MIFKNDFIKVEVLSREKARILDIQKFDTQGNALSVEILKNFFKKHKIVNGIKWKIFHKFLKTGDFTPKVIFAETTTTPPHLSIIDNDSPLHQEHLEQNQLFSQKLHECINNTDLSKEDDFDFNLDEYLTFPVVFLREKKNSLDFVHYKELVDIHGEVITQVESALPFTFSDDFKKTKYSRNYFPIKSGYLTINSKNQAEITTPLIINTQVQKIFIWYLDPYFGEEFIKPFFEKALDTFGLKQHIDRFLESLRLAEIFRIMCIKKGTAAIPATDAKVTFKVKPGNIFDLTPETPLDSFQGRSHFKMIEKEKLILIKQPAQDGTPGKNLYDKVVLPAEAKTHPYEHGDNVDCIKAEGNALVYKSKINGNLFISKDSCQINDVIIISGDHDNEKKDYHYDCDVVVKGHIPSHINIRCDGNLIIKGSVKNNVTIRCAKHCEIHESVLGPNTTLHVGGHLYVNKATKCQIFANRKIIIKETVMESKLFSQKSIFVLGSFANSKKVIPCSNNIMNSYNSIKLKYIKAASKSSQDNKLIVGTNYILKEQLHQLATLIQDKTKNIAKLKDAVEIDMDDPYFNNKLKILPPRKQQIIVQTLNDIKGISEEVINLKNKASQLENLMRTKVNKSAFIEIEKFISGPLSINIANVTDTYEDTHKFDDPYRIELVKDKIIFPEVEE